MELSTETSFRWKAVITYRTDGGPVEVEHDLMELSDLHDLVEHGPHWDTVIQVVVTRANHITSPTLTVEEADLL